MSKELNKAMEALESEFCSNEPSLITDDIMWAVEPYLFESVKSELKNQG